MLQKIFCLLYLTFEFVVGLSMRGSVHLQWALGWNLLLLAVCQLDLESPNLQDCPQLVPKVLVGYVPRGNESAGIYKENANAVTIRSCVALCCEQQNCNVVFMFKQTCFLVCMLYLKCIV